MSLKIKIQQRMFDHTAKNDLKGATGVDTSNLAAKSDLAR